MLLLGANDVGLDLLLSSEPEAYVSHARSFYGIQVAVHASEDFLDRSSVIIAQPGFDIRISITPTVFDTNPLVRNLPIKKRNCFFDDEVIDHLRNVSTIYTIIFFDREIC